MPYPGAAIKSRTRPWQSMGFSIRALMLAAVLLAGCTTTPPVVVSPDWAGRQYVLEPSLSGSEEEFHTDDGKTLGYISYTAPAAKTAVVYLHGIESHAGWFAQAATLLRDQGYDVFCLDRRGSGINRENRGFVSGHIDHYQTLFDDIHRFITPLREHYDQVFLTGLSWGGKLATGYALNYPSDIDGLILITPGIKARVDVSLFTKLKILVFAQTSPQAPIPSPIEPEMFTRTPRYLDYIEKDPFRLTEATASFYWQSNKLEGYIDGNISNNRLPTLLFLAGEDRIIDNPAVIKVLKQGNMTEFEIVDYPDQTHSVQFDAPIRLVNDMDRWMKQQIANTRSSTTGY